MIVVDDGSTDDTARVAQAGGAVLVRQRPAGPAAARNAGVAAASPGTDLAFTDADCEPTPGWLAAGSAALGASDLVQGSVLPTPGVPIGPFDRTVWVGHLTYLFETASLFVRRDLFDSLGGFETWLVPLRSKELAEDVWFGWRARRAGARIAFCEPALVHHAVHPRSAAGFIAEGVRLRFFPAMAARIPELRDTFFYRRLFLTRRAALFDLAVAGTLVAAGTGTWIPLAAAAPYARLTASEGLRWGRRRGPGVIAARVAADAVGLTALAYGSAKSRTLVL